jgi:hypothetical protein
MGGIPELPDDVTDLSDPELMQAFRRLQGWLKFLGTQLALAEVDEKNATSKVASVRSKLKSACRNELRENGISKPTEAELKETVDDHPMLCSANQALEELYAYRKLVGSLHQGVDGDVAICSRELTRRLGTADRDHRAARWST